jgi:enamine deaminase RidA (YjgF/YER057c/UK114 family)
MEAGMEVNPPALRVTATAPAPVREKLADAAYAALKASILEGLLPPGAETAEQAIAEQLGMSRTAPDTTIQGQTRVALESTKKVFEAAGTTLANAVKCTVFLTDVKDFAGMNSVYREFFPVAPPARSTVVVAALVSTGAKVEIECAGVIP